MHLIVQAVVWIIGVLVAVVVLLGLIMMPFDRNPTVRWILGTLLAIAWFGVGVLGLLWWGTPDPSDAVMLLVIVAASLYTLYSGLVIWRVGKWEQARNRP